MVATPLARVMVRLLPWSVAEPRLPRAAVTVWLLSRSEERRVGKECRSRWWVTKTTHTVALAEGCWVMTSWLAAAGLTVILLEVAEVTLAALVLKARFSVSALL